MTSVGYTSLFRDDTTSVFQGATATFAFAGCVASFNAEVRYSKIANQVSVSIQPFGNQTITSTNTCNSTTALPAQFRPTNATGCSTTILGNNGTTDIEYGLRVLQDGTIRISKGIISGADNQYGNFTTGTLALPYQCSISFSQ